MFALFATHDAVPMSSPELPARIAQDRHIAQEREEAENCQEKRYESPARPPTPMIGANPGTAYSQDYPKIKSVIFIISTLKLRTEQRKVLFRGRFRMP